MSVPVRVDELTDESSPAATPPGAGARRVSAPPVRTALLDGTRPLNSLPVNIWRPEASVGPDEDLLDAPPLLELPDDPELSPDDEDEVPLPEVPEDDELDPVVVRGTA
jgi:hypothetical protein